MTPGAVVLCGGQSRRMGQPKAWLPFGPERMLQRVVRLVGEAARPIVVVAAPDQELPPLPDWASIARDPVSGRGPLQGLAAGLAALPESVELAYATATDVPFLQPAWIHRLVDLMGDHDLAIPFIEGYHHPLAALYRRATVLPAIEALLAADRLRPFFLIESVRTLVVGPEELRDADPDLRTLRNLNTPEDYRRGPGRCRPDLTGPGGDHAPPPPRPGIRAGISGRIPLRLEVHLDTLRDARLVGDAHAVPHLEVLDRRATCPRSSRSSVSSSTATVMSLLVPISITTKVL